MRTPFLTLLALVPLLGACGLIADEEKAADLPSTKAPADTCPAAFSREFPTPPSSAAACVRSRFMGADGAFLLARVTKRAGDEMNGSVTTEEFLPDGRVSLREVKRTEAGQTVFESLESPLLPSDATLPDTFGAPVTWSKARTFEGTRLVRVAYDIGIDGVVDDEEVREYFVSGVLRSVTKKQGPRMGGSTLTELYAEHGRILSRTLDTDVETFTYDGAALLVAVERTSSGVVIGRDIVVEEAKERPISRKTDQKMGDALLRVSEETMTYGAAGLLATKDAWRIVEGYRRVSREEYDAKGRPTRSREESESKDCHVFERTNVYGEGPDPRSSKVLCDGALRERTDSELDTAGRMVMSEHESRWGLQPSLMRTERTYSSCGALVRERSSATVVATGTTVTGSEQTWAYNARGNVVLATSSRVGVPGEDRDEYTYDDAGRPLKGNGRTYRYDATGVLAEILYETSPRTGIDVRREVQDEACAP